MSTGTALDVDEALPPLPLAGAGTGAITIGLDVGTTEGDPVVGESVVLETKSGRVGLRVGEPLVGCCGSEFTGLVVGFFVGSVVGSGGDPPILCTVGLKDAFVVGGEVIIVSIVGIDVGIGAGNEIGFGVGAGVGLATSAGGVTASTSGKPVHSFNSSTQTALHCRHSVPRLSAALL